MQIDENIVLNEFAVEYLICKVLDVSERYKLNSNTMGNIITLFSQDAVLRSNKTNNQKLPNMAVELKTFFNKCTTITVDNDSIYMAVIYSSHSNLDFAKMIAHYIQFRCKELNIRNLNMDVLMNQILKYKTWHYSLLKQVWESQKFDNTTLLSGDLVEYISASGSIQFNR